MVTARQSKTGNVLRAVCLPTDQVGDVVYTRGMDGSRVLVGKADPTGWAAMPALGVIVRKWGTSDAFVQVLGPVFGIYSGLEVGKPYVVGPNGRPSRFPSLAPPPGTSYLSQPIGMALSDGVLFVSPSSVSTVRVS